MPPCALIACDLSPSHTVMYCHFQVWAPTRIRAYEQYINVLYGLYDRCIRLYTGAHSNSKIIFRTLTYRGITQRKKCV